MQIYRFVNAQPPQAGVTAPPDVAGSYGAMGAAFGAQVFDLTQEVVAASPADGCTDIANGAALTGLADIVCQAGVTLVGAGIAIEKAFQPGGDLLRGQGMRIESLARIKSMSPGKVEFIH